MMKVIVFALAATVSASAHAQAFKCKEAGTGKTIYSDMPCPTNSTGGYREDFPSVNVGEGQHYKGRSVTSQGSASAGGGAIRAPQQTELSKEEPPKKRSSDSGCRVVPGGQIRCK